MNLDSRRRPFQMLVDGNIIDENDKGIMVCRAVKYRAGEEPMRPRFYYWVYCVVCAYNHFAGCLCSFTNAHRQNLKVYLWKALSRSFLANVSQRASAV
jgi:hypothetical protein